MKSNTIIDMRTSHFPFGEIDTETIPQKKVLVKKRIFYKTEKEYKVLQEKINILKELYHKNAINFREVEDTEEGCIDVFYNYVPYSLENFFQDGNNDIIKEAHKQLIQLVIHLAKNCLLTSFNPNRCGIFLNADNKWQIKYYLPLNEIVITSNVLILERAVQLFTVQSLHFLDTLNENSESTENRMDKANRKTNCSFRESISSKSIERKDSLAELAKTHIKERRRFSNHTPFLKFSRRKLSDISRKKSEFSSESFKHTNASTMFNTLRSSSPTLNHLREFDIKMKNKLKKSETVEIIEKIDRVKERSRIALETFSGNIKTLEILRNISISLKTTNSC